MLVRALEWVSNMETGIMNTKTEHYIRTGAILVLTIACGGAFLFATGLDDMMKGRIEGWLMLLVPALLDSLNVARRQRAMAGGES